ncbi:MAG: hypothetical protein QNJ46_06865 [Leptolyngbyaceae cyanobacterium MO_188.B28]|nr:hypothetical protein [Leptolyngbyaceae cyanobacterium MO_188.B28]
MKVSTGANPKTRATPKTFNLLSIGQRGVGKTVFLAGSYAELHADNLSNHPQPFWFECLDSDVQDNLEKILSHVARTGLYPPATIKITSFDFSLKQHSLWGVKTLCDFRWWDIPGESCNIRNPDFQAMVLGSHSCCVFINANALVHYQEYSEAIEDVFNQVVAIASLVSQHQVQYSFALILTQCDLLEPGPIIQLQVEQSLQALITRLDAVKANYQRFYSAIPIVSMAGTSTLQARGAAAPLLWLLAELNKHHPFHSRQDLVNGLTQNQSVGQILPPHLRRYVMILSVISLSVLGAIASLLFATGLLTSTPEQSLEPELSPSPVHQSGVTP